MISGTTSVSGSPESQRSSRSGTSGATSQASQSGQQRKTGDFTAQTGAYGKHASKTVEHLRDPLVYLNLNRHTKHCLTCMAKSPIIRKVMNDHWENLFQKSYLKEEAKAQKKAIKSGETFNSRVREDIKGILQCIGAKDKTLLKQISESPLSAAGISRLLQQCCNIRMDLLASLAHQPSHPILCTQKTNFIYTTPDEQTLTIWHARRQHCDDYDEANNFSARALTNPQNSDYTDVQYDPQTKQVLVMHGFSAGQHCVLFDYEESQRFAACYLRVHHSVPLDVLRTKELEPIDRMFDGSETFRPHMQFNKEGTYMLIRPNCMDAYCFTRNQEYGTFDPIGVINHQNEPLTQILFSPNNTFMISTSESMEVFWRHDPETSLLESNRCELPTGIDSLRDINKMWCPTDKQCINVLANGRTFTQNFNETTLEISSAEKNLPPLASCDVAVVPLDTNRFISLHSQTTTGRLTSSSPAIKLNQVDSTTGKIENLRSKQFSDQTILRSCISEGENFFAVITQSKKKKKGGINSYNLYIYYKNAFSDWSAAQNIDLKPYTTNFQGSNGADFGVMKFSPDEAIFAMRKHSGQIDLHHREPAPKKGEYTWEQTAFIQANDISDFVFSHNSQMIAVIHSNKTSISLFTQNNKAHSWIALDETSLPNEATVVAAEFRQDDHQLLVTSSDNNLHLYNLVYSLPGIDRSQEESSLSGSDTESGEFARAGLRGTLKRSLSKAGKSLTGSISNIGKAIAAKKSGTSPKEQDVSDTEKKSSSFSTLKRTLSLKKKKGVSRQDSLKKEKDVAVDPSAKKDQKTKKESAAATTITASSSQQDQAQVVTQMVERRDELTAETVETLPSEERTFSYEQQITPTVEQAPEQETGAMAHLPPDEDTTSYEQQAEPEESTDSFYSNSFEGSLEGQLDVITAPEAEETPTATAYQFDEKMVEKLRQGLIERRKISDTQKPKDPDAFGRAQAEAEQQAQYPMGEDEAEEGAYAAEYSLYGETQVTQYAEDSAATSHYAETSQNTVASEEVGGTVEQPSSEASSTIHTIEAEAVDTEPKATGEASPAAPPLPEEIAVAETDVAEAETETPAETTSQAEEAGITEAEEKSDTRSESDEDSDNLLPSDMDFSDDD